MRRNKQIRTALCTGVLALWASHADADDFSARLDGFKEVGGVGAGQTGAILTDATGTLQLDLDKKNSMIKYTLTYTGPFSSAVQQGHIHFGKTHVGGGIFVWLCQTLAKPSPVMGTPTCPTPSPSATVTGTITGAAIIGPTAQNVPTGATNPSGAFDALVDALESNTAYANIHTANFAAGEIRGQIHEGGLNEKHDDHEHK